METLAAVHSLMELQLSNSKSESKNTHKAKTQQHNARTKITTQHSYRVTEIAQSDAWFSLEYHKRVVVEYGSDVLLLGCFGAEGVCHGVPLIAQDGP